jgi:hypothetical protein
MSQLLRKRFRQLMRVTRFVAIGIGLAAASFGIWWLVSLTGLPDIGEPFDTAAFRAFSVPEDQNAFTFLTRADRTLASIPSRSSVTWAEADAYVRSWVESNREAIALFQQGADQADAANPPYDPGVNAQRLATLVLLEASKRQESGDPAGAWDCYRAMLRMATHIRRRGSLAQRQDLDIYWSGSLQRRLTLWAADPQTTIVQVRRALDEVLQSEPTRDWESSAIKSAYLEMMRKLDEPPDPTSRYIAGLQYDYRLGGLQSPPETAGYLDAACRFALREPERSRRVLNLVYANWLAHVESRAQVSRKPALRAVFTLPTSADPITLATCRVSLYAVPPDAPAGARALAPRDVARWVNSTNDAKLRIFAASDIHWPWAPDVLSHRRAFRDLVIMLATELYHREHGTLRASEQVLVGTYLKGLRDDSAADFDDGSVPTIQ